MDSKLKMPQHSTKQVCTSNTRQRVPATSPEPGPNQGPMADDLQKTPPQIMNPSFDRDLDCLPQR
ncbi:GL14251 [Drosophila persimilis]|uniref:GL14251 n=1 Tax=Drosophila persimilis TaxID=7234 RepID=B4GTL8_DROPE|nr:GL14251 [Drosophila persimilis]